MRDNVVKNSSEYRIKWLDISRGICICLVLLGHELTWDNQLRYIIYAFHIPMFYIMCGMTSKITNDFDGEWISFLQNNYVSILKPYLKLSVLYILWDLFSNIISANIPLRRLMLDIIQTISGYGINVLWFLVTLYFAKIIVYTILKCRKVSILTNLITSFVLGIFVFGIIGILSPYFPSNTVGKIIEYFIVGLCRPLVVVPFILFGYVTYDKINICLNKVTSFRSPAVIVGGGGNWYSFSIAYTAL